MKFSVLRLYQRSRAVRIHRFRSRARDALTHLPQTDRTLINAYTAGVNAGLAALTAPPEYFLLGTAPRPWQAEDTLLTIYAMYLDLQGHEADRESFYGIMRDVLPADLYAFLAPPGTEWDAPLQGLAFMTPAPPGPEIVDLRGQPSLPLVEAGPAFQDSDDPVVTGSNNWAVAGSATAHGGALVADDMHLGLSVPNIWYRVSLIYPESNSETAALPVSHCPARRPS
ncbi:MAG: penicillin acylase family protein [Candidatus Competibacteraceae bacterium]